MKRTYGFGIVGTGAIAAKHALAIGELASGKLVAVCSSTAERANLAAEKFAVKAYSDLVEFLAHPELDIVCICTASGNHLEPALEAAKKGKHIIIEKPIEITLERADTIIQACENKDVKLGVIYQNRFNEGYEKLKKGIDDGLFGDILMANAYVNWFRSETYYSSSAWKGTLEGDGGGALINQGIHTIDLMIDAVGEVRSVFGKIKTSLHPIEAEDLVTAVVGFKNGALGNVTASTALYPGYPEKLEIYGSKGSVILEAGKITHWQIRGDKDKRKSQKNSNSGAADPMAIGHQQHLLQFEDFIQAIETNGKPLVDGPIARKSLELILAIYESSKQGVEVEVGVR